MVRCYNQPVERIGGIGRAHPHSLVELLGVCDDKIVYVIVRNYVCNTALLASMLFLLLPIKLPSSVVVLLLGPCRTGSTALLHPLGRLLIGRVLAAARTHSFWLGQVALEYYFTACGLLVVDLNTFAHVCLFTRPTGLFVKIKHFRSRFSLLRHPILTYIFIAFHNFTFAFRSLTHCQIFK